MKKCTVFNDMSGYGKCSLMASIPIFAVMGIELHPVPTAILTKQTAYDNYSSFDLTDFMSSFNYDWKEEKFDAIMTGFISNVKQFDIIESFINVHKNDDTIIVVDPVMADDGALYDTFDEEKCERIRALSNKATIITPNISELALLVNEPYSENSADIKRYGDIMLNKGVKTVIATGRISNDEISTFVFEKGISTEIKSKRYDGSFSGTGDIMTSIVTASILLGKSVCDGVRLASEFISKSIKSTLSKDKRDGIDFEKYLGDLIL